MNKTIAEMTDAELASELRTLDRVHGSTDPNGRKKDIRRELFKRGKLSEATGYSMEVLMRNPLIRAELEEFRTEE